ncbi:MAG: AI-2E family transporter, partial [Solirubrobacteraceae bacterium]
LYGASVGLSPFGVVFSAVFWAWLWGVPGLLLATPLTVCLVVAGRYLRSLQMFTVLLGDEPALPVDVRLYQRLLSLDFTEAESILKECARGASLEALSDDVVMPVLRRLAEDDQRDAVPDERSAQMRERLDALLAEIAASANETTVDTSGDLRVLFVPALDENDAIASRWLAHVVTPRGVKATIGSPEQLASEVVQQVTALTPDVVCVSALSGRAVFQSRLVLKRLVEADFARPLIVGLWAAPAHELEKYAARNTTEDALCTASVVQLEAALASQRARRGPSTL